METALEHDNPDILCLSEHWLNKGEEEVVKLKDYVNTAVYCREIKKRGGSAILVRNCIQTECLDMSNLQQELDFECVGITVNRLIIVCVYRSPKGNVNVFLDKLESFLRMYGKDKKELVMCGDINIDYLTSNFRKTTWKRKLCAILDEYGCRNILKNATRITLNTQTLIDCLITNIGDDRIITIQDNIDLALSDHSMQSVEITFATLREGKKFKFIRVVNETLIEKFNEVIKQESWEELEGNLDVNTKFNLFHNKFKQHYDSVFVLKRINLNYKPRKKWITRGIKISKENLWRLNYERKKVQIQ